MEARTRPRFERRTQVAPEVLRQRLKAAIVASDGDLSGEVLEHHAQVMIAGSRRHTWSPCLSITFKPIDDTTGCYLRIRGLFGPRPALWTVVATLYSFAAFVIFICLVLACSQWLLDQTPSALIGVPIGALIAGLLYAVSLSGQALAQREIGELLELLDQAIAPAEDGAPSG
ncbi:MAG: hypothetical protein AAF581_17740 [Planctomycetota bacterium]